MSENYAPLLIEELRTHGVRDWRLDNTGTHNKLYFSWGGRTLMHVFPKTPSDRRGVLNSLSDLRHSMNVRRVIRKSENLVVRKRRAAVSPTPSLKGVTITTRPDPFVILNELKKPEVVRCPRMTLAQIAEMLDSATR